MFAFLDVETTGLSPSANYVLEVAWVLTDNKFNQISEPRTYLVDHIHNPDVLRQIQKSSFLMNMHMTSGLYQDLEAAEAEDVFSMEMILDAFIADALEHGAPEDYVRLAGYSVDFDRNMLKAHGWYELFETGEYPFQMHHRIMDISSNIQMWEAADRQVPYVVNENAHRALDDALHAMKVAQAMRDEISWAVPL
jgi:oligoribonuclease (3'-5' exoribonuclease)